MTMNVFVHHFIPPNDTMQDLIVDKCWMSECIGRPGSKPSCATNYSCDPEPTIYEDSLFSYVQWRVKTRSAWLGGTVLLFPPAYTMVDVANYHLVLPCEPRRSLGPFWIQYIWLLLLIVCIYEVKFICYLRSAFSLTSLTMVLWFWVILFLKPQAQLKVGNILWSFFVSRCSLKQ